MLGSLISPSIGPVSFIHPLMPIGKHKGDKLDQQFNITLQDLQSSETRSLITARIIIPFFQRPWWVVQPVFESGGRHGGLRYWAFFHAIFQ